MAAEKKPAVGGPAHAEGAPPSELKRLGKYQIEKKIGAGGMGAVFLARDTELKRVVALKVLPRDKASNPTLVRRFRAEAQAAAQLRHDNIVAVYDSGEADGYLYIAMEYVDGQDLFEMVARRGVVPVKRSIEIIKQVASALQHAYEQNIVHRDIKPSNLLIRRDGVVKLTDLGLARSVDDTLETNITRAGTTVGTVDYMSPEQARHSKLADIRSDLYSLGCTWYQMLTGSPPYPEGSVTNKLQAHAIKPIPDPREKNPNIPEGLTAVLHRLMAKKPEDRYQTPADLIDELNHATLTKAAISREIFSDLSDYEQDAVVQFEDEDSNDGYLETDVEPLPEEPEADSGPRRKAPMTTRSQVNADSKESSRPARTRARTTTEEVETDSDDEVAPARTSGANRFGKVTRTETTEKRGRVAESPDRGSPADDSDSDDHGEVHESGARKLKTKPGKPEVTERPGKTEVTESQAQGSTKVSDSRANKSKPFPQKQLPPKMQPAAEVPGDKPAVSKDLLMYIAVAAGFIAVVGGIGWWMSTYSSNVAINPMAVPQAAQVAPAIPAVPSAATQTPEANSAQTETTSANPAAAAKVEQQPVFDAEKIPDWAGKEVTPPGLQQLTVGPATASATHFNTIEAALKSIPETIPGAVVRLQGDGPFPLPRVELAGCRHLVITKGAEQSHPVITFNPAEGQQAAGLKLSEGRLELKGVHFAIERRVITAPFKAVEVVDGQLFVQQCSFTAVGTGNEPLTCMAVSSPQDSSTVPRIEPTLLIDQVFVRGDGLTAIDIQRANLDAVIRNSLFACGTAPAVDVSGHLVTGVADVVTLKPRRVIRIVRSTIFTQNRVLDLAVDEKGKPPQTIIVLRDSLCCSQGAVGSTVANAAHWPQVRSTTESWLTRLSWISTNSLYLGFEQLIDLGASFRVADAATWQRIWNTKPDARQFHKLAFPETSLDDLSVVLPQEFDSSALTYRDVKSADGKLPGCSVTQLSVPDANSQSRLRAVIVRPPLPPIVIKPSEPVEVRKVDLKKEDLGSIINKNDWRSGTLFEAYGGGLCMMSPAKIEGKSLKIVFRQADGATLKVQPAQTKQSDAKGDIAALISISKGTLELTNVTLEGYPTTKGATPEWILQATDSTVVLNGCRLLGSETDNARQLGLVRWVTSTGPSPFAEPLSFVCRESYLAGTGSGIRMDVGQGNLILRNSVIAVRGDALDIRPQRSSNALSSVIDAELVTLSASGAAIRYEAAPGSEPVTSPVRLFFDRCVIAPPLSFKSGEASGATFLKCVGPALEQRQISWWGASNGVAKQVVYLIRQDETSPPSDEKTGLTAWRRTWEKSNTMRLLTGDKGVYLTGELPNRWRELKPGSFELHKSSQAATWAEGGRPIGANVASIEGNVAKKPGPEPVNKGVATPATPNKKNVGF